MKTFKNLYKGVYDFSNLLKAFKKAAKGKRKQVSVARFEANLEYELLLLEKELKTKTYQPGSYRAFTIYDPKQRLISAAPFRDRVVHHALCNIIEPIYESSFIFDSYANRKGKGTHKAIERYQYYAQRYPYVLKCDIRKFFPSIDLEILKGIFKKKIACKDTLWLINIIIDNSNPQEEHLQYFPNDNLFTPCERRKGLPIGNLTSQFWANVYMNHFDHFIKEVLCVPGYIRYVDDFVLFHHDTSVLKDYKKALQNYLAKLRLVVHPNKTQIHSVIKGVPFLGFRIFPFYKLVNKQKVFTFRRSLKRKIEKIHGKRLLPILFENAINSWLGHIRFGQTQRLRKQVFSFLLDNDIEVFKHPKGGWRILMVE